MKVRIWMIVEPGETKFQIKEKLEAGFGFAIPSPKVCEKAERNIPSDEPGNVCEFLLDIDSWIEQVKQHIHLVKG